MRQDRTIAESESYIDAASQITDLNQLISDNKDVWVKGLDGVELTAEEQSVYQGMWWALWVRKIAQWQRAQRLTNTLNTDSIVQGFAYDIYLYPGLRRIFEETASNLDMKRGAFGRNRSDASFLASVEKALAQLDSSPPQLHEKTYYIY